MRHYFSVLMFSSSITAGLALVVSLLPDGVVGQGLMALAAATGLAALWFGFLALAMLAERAIRLLDRRRVDTPPTRMPDTDGEQRRAA